MHRLSSQKILPNSDECAADPVPSNSDSVGTPPPDKSFYHFLCFGPILLLVPPLYRGNDSEDVATGISAPHC